MVVLLRSGWLRSHGRQIKNPLEPLANLAQGHEGDTGPSQFDWGPVIVVGLDRRRVVLGAPRLLSSSSAGGGARGGAAIPAAELAAALERTIADLRAEPDPRRAVIAAYAQMEQALGRAGLAARRRPRRRASTSAGCCPRSARSADSVARLTSLFERAKFSPHAIDETMKEEAISALESLRDDLRADE